MVSFEIFVKAMPPSLSELKVLPSFCFAFKIPDDVAASNIYTVHEIQGPFIYTVAISDTLYFRVSKIWKTFSIAVCPSKNKEVEK